ncbi:MYXO-CTERM sorting domain-containing protein [Streptomyces sp. NPDC059897]
MQEVRSSILLSSTGIKDPVPSGAGFFVADFAAGLRRRRRPGRIPP